MWSSETTFFYCDTKEKKRKKKKKEKMKKKEKKGKTQTFGHFVVYYSGHESSFAARAIIFLSNLPSVKTVFLT